MAEKTRWKKYMDELYVKAFLSCVITGTSCGLAGAFILLLEIPFVGVAVSHAAMAGGVWGVVFGLPGKVSAFAASILMSALLGPVSDKVKSSVNSILSVMFAFLMALALLGVGLFEGHRQMLYSVLWGNVFLSGWMDILFSVFVLVLELAFIIYYYSKLMFVLFNREMALANGIKERRIYYLMLLLTGAVVSAGLNTAGGLMIFGMIILPAAAAKQACVSFKSFLILSAAAGFIGGALGSLLAFALNLPLGATVVLFMAGIFTVSAVYKHFWRLRFNKI
ncbi:MAG: metal ABC transporter permease [Candidatus Goldbacteria bacterium]|nr:metal ABC transporter permease [Candidatus Goldiibacteriota bacterium]